MNFDKLSYQNRQAQLPKGWEIRKLGDVCLETSNIKWNKSHKEEYHYIDLSAVNRDELTITETTLVNFENAPSRAKKIIKKGDIIFATTRPTLKRLTIIPESYDNQICSTGFTVLRPNPNKITSEYLFYSLLQDSFMILMESLQRGASYPAVSDSDVKGFEIPIPPMPEQQRIVSILDRSFAAIDQAKANYERCLSLSKDLFESYLQGVFDPSTLSEQVKGNGWEEKHLKDISLVFGRGKSKHRPRNWEGLYGGDYPFIQTGEVRNANKYVSDYSKTYNEVGLAQSKLWKKGTICITIAANIAETAILNFDACFPDSIIGLEVDPEKADLDFTYYLLQFFKAALQKLGKGSAQDNINLGTFENRLFPFPKSVEKQKEIVNQIDTLRNETQKLETLYQKKIAALVELKKSILQKAFQGELKVSELGFDGLQEDRIKINA